MYQRVFELQADILKALAHPRRLEIVQLLRDQALCVSDIFEMLDLPQANISQHLMLLRDAGIVTTHREGKQIVYALAHTNVIEACDLLKHVVAQNHRDSEIVDHLMLSMNELVPVVHDVVCGMRVSPKTAGGRATHQNKDYFFCASGCLKKFTSNPEVYASS
jgi:DNA-binding transcriptional ArsR family regulator